MLERKIPKIDFEKACDHMKWGSINHDLIIEYFRERLGPQTSFSLLHCMKTRILWKIFFFFSLVGGPWVLPSSIKETILSSHGLFVGKET